MCTKQAGVMFAAMMAMAGTTLRLVGRGRFQGTGSNGQTITVWR